MAEEKNTVGYTESIDYRCLEDLQEVRNLTTANLINLDYCGRERCKGGYSFGPYTRENYVLHVILEGKGELRVGDHVYPVRKDQVFLLYPGVEAVYQADWEDPWVYAWIGFHGFQSEKIINAMGFSKSNYIVDVKDSRILGDYINAILDHSQLNYANYLRRIAYMELFFGEIIDYADVPAREERFSEDTYVNMAIETIIANYQHSVKISKIASQIGINRSYLSIIFKKKTGISPQQFLIDFRMERAAELLTETSLSIRAIAAQVGYSDSLTFSKAFKLKFGVNPTSYRESPPTLTRKGQKGEYIGKYGL